MTEREIERLAELVAIKVSERYLLINKAGMKAEIALHRAECKAGKFTKLMGVAYAIVGGVVVAVINWLLAR